MTVIFTIVIVIIILFALWILLRCFYKPFDGLGTFTLFFGSPGCGKTSFACRDALWLLKHKHLTYTNIGIGSTVSRSDFGVADFGAGAKILYDEASVSGFDNRDFTTNFKGDGGKALTWFKFARHYRAQLIFYNQGYDELDKKLRTLCDSVWLVRKIGPFSMAILIRKRVEINQDDHSIQDGYYYPSVLGRIFNRHYIRIIFRPLYYKQFDSFSKAPNLRLIPYDTLHPYD